MTSWTRHVPLPQFQKIRADGQGQKAGQWRPSAGGGGGRPWEAPTTSRLLDFTLEKVVMVPGTYKGQSLSSYTLRMHAVNFYYPSVKPREQYQATFWFDLF